jgi:H+-translocating NAD(P) transhydrogenase subunit beta
VILGVAIGGSIGAVIESVPMASMPELVAAFHPLVAAAAFYAPGAFDIGGRGSIHGSS